MSLNTEDTVSDTKHTPWKVIRGDIVAPSDLPGVYHLPTPDEAAYAVHCVNTHSQLLDTLKVIASNLGHLDLGGLRVDEYARAAIARAEGGES